MARPRNKGYTIRHHSWRDKVTGERCASQEFHIYFRDHNQIQRDITADANKKVCEYIAENIMLLINLKKLNRPITAELRDFPELQPKRILKKLFKWDLVDTDTMAGFKPLLIYKDVKKKHSSVTRLVATGGHVFEWEKSLSAKNNTKHNEQNVARVMDIIIGCGFKAPNDITADKLITYLESLQETGTSPQTCNAYIKRFKVFTKWMLKERRLSYNPLIYIELFEVTGPVRKRRALPRPDAIKFLKAARNSEKKVRGLTGRERYLAYIIAMTDGFRWGSLRNIKRKDVHLDSNPPIIIGRKEHAKGGKDIVQPIRRELAEKLYMYLANNPGQPDDILFPNINKQGGNKMVKSDLEEAGIPYETENDFCDFHALRRTLATMLSCNDIIDETIQIMLDHSKVKVTQAHYIERGDQNQCKKLQAIETLSDELFASNWNDDDSPKDADKFTANFTRNSREHRRNSEYIGEATDVWLDAYKNITTYTAGGYSKTSNESRTHNSLEG